MPDIPTLARARIHAALSQLGTEGVTRNMVVLQVDDAERQFMLERTSSEFGKARAVWAREREDCLSEKFPKWFKARERKSETLFR